MTLEFHGAEDICSFCGQPVTWNKTREFWVDERSFAGCEARPTGKSARYPHDIEYPQVRLI